MTRIDNIYRWKARKILYQMCEYEIWNNYFLQTLLFYVYLLDYQGSGKIYSK